MADFFDMGGYGIYLWPAYGVTILGVVVLAITSWRGQRQQQRLLDEMGPRRTRMNPAKTKASDEESDI